MWEFQRIRSEEQIGLLIAIWMKTQTILLTNIMSIHTWLGLLLTTSDHVGYPFVKQVMFAFSSSLPLVFSSFLGMLLYIGMVE